ncbi:MAG: DUF3095 domain-containing protein [Rubricoccaceae bacterium]
MPHHTFYEQLKPLERFADLVTEDAYAPVPPEWTVVISDVKGSTQAVKEGRYRDVNYVGAASIAAVLNATDQADIPFVFGGDGATLVLPPVLLSPSLSALAALQAHAQERLELTLRVGVVSVAEIRAAGRTLDIARLQVSPNYAQALFRGDGLAWAEDKIKAPETAAQYASSAMPEVGDDPYAGLECRWQDIPSPHGETVSLLIEAVGPRRDAIYREVLPAIERIYGPDTTGHPIALEALKISGAPSRLDPEVRLRHTGSSWRYRTKTWVMTLVGKFLIWRRAQTSETDWETYPSLLRDSTDYRKFDGVLRMILAGTPEQRRQLEADLEARFVAGTLAYGIHVSDRAVMTCLVYERMGRQVHFVDGAGGGYTAAAVGFKARLKSLISSS